MNQRERFRSIMSYEPYDRMPVWFFGVWKETKERWMAEGLADETKIEEQTGMDPDWECDMWSGRFVNPNPVSARPEEIIEESERYKIVRTSLNAVIKFNKTNSSIPQHIEHALKPTRRSWNEFKAFIDPGDSNRYTRDWEKKADLFNGRERVATFLAGSLFGWPREWMGVEQWGCLAYTDPVLFEEILDYLSDYFITLYRSVLQKAHYDFAYFFEDCCFNNGPLFSPEVYKLYFDKYYRRMVDFYKSMGIEFILIDSDGKVDLLIPHWLDSGFDIVFPIEIGAWGVDPRNLRKRFGKRLRMMGGIDKNMLPSCEKNVYQNLKYLRKPAAEGGFIPLPDHRIPPSCSFEQFKTYIKIFKTVFNF